tara:strand:+ start:3343 stop:4389 length:1047 start_codon:yes stop_codon:yes gene_type:complete
MIRATLFAGLLASAAVWADDVPRTQDGKPDLSGFYDIATLTPLERPRIFGDSETITKEQAETIASRAAAGRIAASQNSDPERGAPPQGGDGSRGAAGNVGGYNAFWIDNGVNTIQVDGKFRTSLVTSPKNGRLPKMLPAAADKRRKYISRFRHNEGVAWWLEVTGKGPYDDPESLTLSDRCLVGFGSTAGPPMLPVLYNNLKKIVQTPEHVMILTEMVHDARIIRLNADHLPAHMTSYLGDSIGHWVGDTLIVDTTNFNGKAGIRGGSENLHVVEHFRMVDKDTVIYSFTVEDATVWEAPWSGEYPWPRSDQVVYEYACHEGNYAMGNILRGARLLEQDALNAQAGGL